MSWLRWFRRSKSQAQDWRLVVDGHELAALRDPQFAEMFWTSFEVAASTTPPDPRLRDEAFWQGDAWTLVDAMTGRAAPLAIASSAGLGDDGRRVTLRGAYLD